MLFIIMIGGNEFDLMFEILLVGSKQKVKKR